MRVLGQLCVRNEADRYLDCVLSWHCSFLDGVHVYDDHSTDETVELALSHGCAVTQRQLGPAFLAHEGLFREAAWRAFEEAMQPEEGDWVLALDADEFLMASNGADEADAVRDHCDNAQREGCVGMILPIPEVFSVTAQGEFLTDPHVRVDGLWATIASPRLFRYQRGGMFANRAMGSGAEPTYVAAGMLTTAAGLYLMHYGYAEPDDARLKYERYSSMDHGHLDAHVQSIPTEPVLSRWDGPCINIWRGWRTRTVRGAP